MSRTAQYLARSVVVEARQWNGSGPDAAAIAAWMKEHGFRGGALVTESTMGNRQDRLTIVASDARYSVEPGTWVVRYADRFFMVPSQVFAWLFTDMDD